MGNARSQQISPDEREERGKRSCVGIREEREERCGAGMSCCLICLLVFVACPLFVVGTLLLTLLR